MVGSATKFFAYCCVFYFLVYDYIVLLQPQSGITLGNSAGTVGFEPGVDSVQLRIPIEGDGFLAQGTTFTATITQVQYLGAGGKSVSQQVSCEVKTRIKFLFLKPGQEDKSRQNKFSGYNFFGVFLTIFSISYLPCCVILESTTICMYHLYRDREIHPSVEDLKSTTRLAELVKLHIFDRRVDFPVPVQSGCWLFFSYHIY